MNAKNVLSLALVCAMVPISTEAITYIAPHDHDLIKAARSIVIATAEASYDELMPDGRIVTVAELRVKESLKGNLETDRLVRLREMGGTIGDLTLTVPGSPRYAVGNRYLIFVGVNNHEELCTAGMAIGQFVFETDADGHSILQRAVAEGSEDVGPSSGDYARDADAFVEYVRGIAAGEPVQPSYWIRSVSLPPDFVAASKFNPTTFFLRGDYLMTGNPRWQNPTATFATFGSEAGVANAVSLSSSAAGAWTGAGANIHYTVSGTTTKHGGLETFDGSNEILFDDPNGVVAAHRTSCGCGVIAIGGSWNSGTHNLGGETFSSIVNGEVEVGTSLGLPSNQFQAAMTHELGHTLGFRHSDGTASSSSPPPSCTAPSPCAAIGAAIMASAIPSNITTTLKQWDQDAASTVYGSGCTAPAISVDPAGSTISQGQSANMSVSATGTATLTYQWYIGPKSDISNPIGGQTNSSITVSPSSTTTYWVRVTNSCGTADSNAATITVTPCTAPQITTQPTGSTITFGSSAQLSVVASGSPTLTYQWYTGAKGNTSNPVFNGTTASISVSPQSTTSYWVRVTNSCGTADSNAATVTVNCLAPQVSATPPSRTITQGSSTIFSSVATGGPNMTFQWYQGIAPDTSNPVAGQTGSSITVSPSASTSYWIQASVSGCGTANSNTVVVTVNPNNGCPAVTVTTPTVTQNGVNYTLATTATTGNGGGTVTITWFQQTNSGQTAVGTGPSIVVSPTVTTTYLAQASNTCGSSNSATVTVTIAPSGCTAPTVTQPSDQTVGLGTSTTIAVTASGTATLHYQWYQGAAGNTSVPVGTDSATLATGPLTSNRTFWVKVTNDCGNASSTTVTVTVEPARRRSVHH